MCSHWIVKLAKDMNGDGYFTISDVGMCFKYLFFLPGDYLIGLIIIYFSTFAKFFEVNPDWCHGFLAGLAGFAFWAFCFIMLIGFVGVIYEELHKWFPSKQQPK